MDKTTIIVVAIISAVVIVGIVAFRKGWFEAAFGVLGIDVSFRGSNKGAKSGAAGADTASGSVGGGVVVEDARSHKGGLQAHADDGGGAEVRRVETEGDISVSSRRPSPKG